MREVETRMIPGLQRLVQVERNIRTRVQLEKGIAVEQTNTDLWVAPSARDLREMKREIKYMGQPR